MNDVWHQYNLILEYGKTYFLNLFSVSLSIVKNLFLSNKIIQNINKYYIRKKNIFFFTKKFIITTIIIIIIKNMQVSKYHSVSSDKTIQRRRHGALLPRRRFLNHPCTLHHNHRQHHHHHHTRHHYTVFWSRVTSTDRSALYWIDIFRRQTFVSVPVARATYSHQTCRIDRHSPPPPPLPPPPPRSALLKICFDLKQTTQ